jgi:hypothetical protein
VDAPPPDLRHADTVRRLREGGDGLPLPGRLSLFGHTRLPVTEVALLEALAEGKPVTAGSQTGRRDSCPAGGPTSLKDMVAENHDYRGEWA